MQCLVNMVDESELPSQTVAVFPGHQRNLWSCIVLRKDYVFPANFRCFSRSDLFSWSNWEQCLLELLFGFSEGAHNRGLPPNSTIYTTSPSLDEDWALVWLVMVHFTFPVISCVPHYCTVSTLYHLSQFVLKMEHLIRNDSRKQAQECFSHLMYVETKHQTSK